MTWLLKAGDDAAYAQPNFDDSKWTVVDPNETLLRTFQKRPEIVWYRLHVKVAPNETGLALGEFYLDSAFEIYINGEKFMTTGTVSPFKPSTLMPISSSAFPTQTSPPVRLSLPFAYIFLHRTGPPGSRASTATT